MGFKKVQAIEFPLSRPLLIGLLAAYSSVMVLHLHNLPWWVILVCGGIILWRINILREYWRAPGKLLKIILVLLVVVGAGLQYSQWTAVEPMITAFILALSLKLLEIRCRRDYLLILFLAYVAVACSFLFDQSILHSLLAVGAIFIITTVLLHYYCINRPITQNLRLVLLMLLQSSALMLLMLLVVPRLGPLWSVPLQSGSATVGINDNMSPGDFDQLIRSNELALRITFKDTVIPPAQRYWRGLVLENFDGRRWQRSESINASLRTPNSQPATWLKPIADAAKTVVEYEVLMEPSYEHWLFGVPVLQTTLPANYPPSTIIYTPQQEVLLKQPVGQRMQYMAISSLHRPAVIKPLADNSYRKLTALPSGTNPQTRAQALEWRRQFTNHHDYINKVLDFYQQHFTYTLSPPTLGLHSVDEFLFSSRQGFCEHFASSFVVLMRSVGIPARVVVGYQGGQWSQNKEYLTIYQRDAHAWAEVWLQDKGWRRIDPTAAVTAVRIEQGLAAALPPAEREQLNYAYDRFQWLRQWYLQWQQMDYRWQRWVLDYDSQKQQRLLSKYLGEITATKLVLALLIPLIVIVLLFSIIRLRAALRVPVQVKLYRRLQKQLASLGVKYQKGESISHYCDRAAQQHPQMASQLAKLKQAFEHAMYTDAGEFIKVKEALKAL